MGDQIWMLLLNLPFVFRDLIMPPLSRASSAATVNPLSHTASRTIGVLDTPQPTRRAAWTGATAAGSTR